MIEEETPDVFGYTVFCDDIRQEANGKLIFIGVYQGTMLINADFPQTLSKLSLSLHVIMKTELAKPPIKLRIFVPGDEESSSVEAELGETEEGGLQRAAAENSKALGIPVEDHIHTVFFANMSFENFVIKEPGRIRVRVDIDGKRYKLGSLNVAKHPQLTQ
jgi:hypothetical protein